jgi:UDP-N-acetylglucosamine 3-dehydrogenase
VSIQKIDVVLVGLGRMGSNHFRVLRESPHFKLVGVVDNVASKPDASLLGNARFARTIEELDDVPYAAAVVSTPTVTHFDVASSLIERGKHLLVEKPLASTFELSKEICRKAEAKGIKLGVGHVERFNPAVRKLREVIAAGWLGTPIHFSFTRVGGYPQTLTSGNNVMLDLAVHDIDVLRSLVGPLRVASSICHSTVQHDVLDTGELLLHAKSGPSATVHVNWITPTKIRTIRVTGTRGVCFVDYILQTCELHGGNLLKANVPNTLAFDQLMEFYRTTDKIQFGVRTVEPLKAQLEAFYGLLTNGDAGELCLGADATSAVVLAERAMLQDPTRVPPSDFV